MAAGKGRLDIIRFLLEYGTDKLLAEGTNGTDALVCACEKSHPEVVKYFMEKGFDVRSVSSEGRTPLHAAAEGERPDIVELLVHHGAVLDATDQAGNTPLHVAASIGSVHTALWLRRRGSDLTARNHCQQTPHMIAKSSLERRQSKSTERLVEILDWNVPLPGADADDRQECVTM
ncbi:hypothetical protein JMJ35_008798 [Cladonia borealis]|uniref:Ankyrin repeat protein n=1 Tax=Cladonia borealis TaxID=184061 RepID=A0AA39QSR8_9LECA|nr:hypothetical protein JMJ35_008798 [Cladonia borealis]